MTSEFKIFAGRLADEISRVRGLESADMEIREDTALRSELGVDSLALLEVAIMVEVHYSVNLHDDEIDEIRTAGDLYELIQSKVRANKLLPSGD